jgi:hypothetical protein
VVEDSGGKQASVSKVELDEKKSSRCSEGVLSIITSSWVWCLWYRRRLGQSAQRFHSLWISPLCLSVVLPVTWRRTRTSRGRGETDHGSSGAGNQSRPPRKANESMTQPNRSLQPLSPLQSSPHRSSAIRASTTVATTIPCKTLTYCNPQPYSFPQPNPSPQRSPNHQAALSQRIRQRQAPTQRKWRSTPMAARCL